MGKVSEQLLPYLPGFRFNPKDARFLGSPVDLVVFDGLAEGELRGVWFLEVKTGNAGLSGRERQVRDAILRSAWGGTSCACRAASRSGTSGRAHPPRDLLDEFGGNDGRERIAVTLGIELHDVGADDRDLQLMQHRQDLPHRQASRLRM